MDNKVDSNDDYCTTGKRKQSTETPESKLKRVRKASNVQINSSIAKKSAKGSRISNRSPDSDTNSNNATSGNESVEIIDSDEERHVKKRNSQESQRNTANNVSFRRTDDFSSQKFNPNITRSAKEVAYESDEIIDSDEERYANKRIEMNTAQQISNPDATVGISMELPVSIESKREVGINVTNRYLGKTASPKEIAYESDEIIDSDEERYANKRIERNTAQQISNPDATVGISMELPVSIESKREVGINVTNNYLGKTASPKGFAQPQETTSSKIVVSNYDSEGIVDSDDEMHHAKYQPNSNGAKDANKASLSVSATKETTKSLEHTNLKAPEALNTSRKFFIEDSDEETASIVTIATLITIIHAKDLAELHRKLLLFEGRLDFSDILFAAFDANAVNIIEYLFHILLGNSVLCFGFHNVPRVLRSIADSFDLSEDIRKYLNLNKRKSNLLAPFCCQDKLAIALLFCDYFPNFCVDYLSFSTSSHDNPLIFDLIGVETCEILHAMLRHLASSIPTFRRQKSSAETMKSFVHETFRYRSKHMSHCSFCSQQVVKNDQEVEFIFDCSQCTSCAMTEDRKFTRLLQLTDQTEDDEACGSSLLHWSIESEGLGSFPIRLLEMAPFLAECVDNNNVTPLHSSCLVGRAEVVRALLNKYDVDIIPRDSLGWTPLMYAIRTERVDCSAIICGSKKFDLQDQLLVMGKTLSRSSEEMDPMQYDMVKALSTIPEFQDIINSCLNKYPHLMEHGEKLSFVQNFGFLLTTSNKLKLANILSRSSVRPVREVVSLNRADAWSSLVMILSNLRRKGDSRDNWFNYLRNPALIYQFSEEVGTGYGVEREAISTISSCLVQTNNKHRIFEVVNNFNHAVVPVKELACRLNNLSSMGSAPKVTTNKRKKISKTKFTRVDIVSIMNSSAPADVKLYAVSLITFGAFLGNLFLSRLTLDITKVVTINIPTAIWKLLLLKPINLSDIADIDKDKFSSLQYVLDCEDVADLSLTFTFAEEGASTSSRVRELVPGGQSIDVINSNRKEYVKKLIDVAYNESLSISINLIRDGMLCVVPEQVINLFNESELALLICGSTKITVSEWKQFTEYANYQSDSLQIIWFWEFIETLDQDKLALLLKFCTGSTRLPAGGFRDVSPQFRIQRVDYNPDRALPTAATCFNLIRLPTYPSRYHLTKNLMTAIVFGNDGFTYS